MALCPRAGKRTKRYGEARTDRNARSGKSRRPKGEGRAFCIRDEAGVSRLAQKFRGREARYVQSNGKNQSRGQARDNACDGNADVEGRRSCAEGHRKVFWPFACAGQEASGIDGMRNAMTITAQNCRILQGGGNYRLILPDSFDAHTRRERPFRSPRRVRFLDTTIKESKQ